MDGILADIPDRKQNLVVPRISHLPALSLLNCERWKTWERDGPIICSSWNEWSTIQGVIAWVISKLDEREARGRFEIMMTITPWIVRHKVQLLINRIYNKFRKKMSFENFFWAKTSVALLVSFENCRKHCKEAIKVRLTDVKIAWLSSYRYPITKLQIGHL